MEQNKIIYQDIREQTEFMIEVLQKNKQLVRLLHLIESFGLPDWYLASGAICQTVWNCFHGFDLNFGINDYDVVYFDADISYEKEDFYIQKSKEIFKDFDREVQLRNQARVHLWFPKKTGIQVPPFTCVEEAIATFPTTSTSIGITLVNKDKIKVVTPRGLYDLLTMTVRANKVRVSKEVYEKKAADWSSKWPKLTVIHWDYQR